MSYTKKRTPWTALEKSMGGVMGASVIALGICLVANMPSAAEQTVIAAQNAEIRKHNAEIEARNAPILAHNAEVAAHNAAVKAALDGDRLNAEAEKRNALKSYNTCGDFGAAFGGCAGLHEVTQQLKNANRVEECLNVGHSRTYCNQQ
jgi:hypothetical protein